MFQKSDKLPITKKLVSFNCDGESVEVVYRIPSNLRWPEGGGPPDDLVKIVYKVVDGTIQVVDYINGKVEPQRIVPEKFIFEDEK
jgi:hypothetical protein